MRELAARRDGIWEYILVTLAYWGFTITDGAIRMLVLFQFYLLGYSAFQIAFLFLFYEVFGVITNLVGGWIGANFGLRITLMAGGWIQIASLVMLAFVNASWPVWLVVTWVMVSQAMSGIAKDLTKMSSKSAIKSVVPQGSDERLYHWVSVLTGSKNALKGVGFFVGALLLTVVGFPISLLLMAAGLLALQLGLTRYLPDNLGKAKSKSKFATMFALDRRVNILSAARFFLFGARDVWFVVALPVFMASIFGWSPLVVAGYLALWTIGYGIVQSTAPKFISAKDGGPPKAHTVIFWATVLAGIPAAISLALASGLMPALSLTGGLAIFGVVFAINSAVHSFMIVHYSESEKAAMTVGFYYMANAGGRLIGTVLSGVVYQFAGIAGCLWISSLFVVAAALISTGLALPEPKHDRLASPPARAALVAATI
ncbi:MAG TPA: organoarsenical effux MFS transporter ArsJ [Thermoanaerobaculia bacterium]